VKVLFVCHGNINRSPAAEIIAKQLYPHWSVKSCGLKTWPGRITAKKMRDTLNARGFVTEGIRSTPITPELVQWADKIFYMDGGNEKRFLAKFGKLDKAQRLSDHVPGAKKIPDPTWGEGYVVHNSVIDLVTSALSNWQKNR